MPGDNEKDWRVWKAKDLALHRMKGFPIWPVQVLDREGKYEHDLPDPAKGQASNMLPVYYFNSKNYGWVKPTELQDLDEKPAKMKGGQAEAFKLAQKAKESGPVADPLAAFLEQKEEKKRKAGTSTKAPAEKKAKVEPKNETAEKASGGGKAQSQKKAKVEPEESDPEGSAYDAQAEANKLLEKEKAEQRKRERELEIEREFEEDIADLIEGSDDDESNEKQKKKKKKEKKEKKIKKERKKHGDVSSKKASPSNEDEEEEVIHHHHSKKSSRSPKKSRRIDDEDDDENDNENDKKTKLAEKEQHGEKERHEREKKDMGKAEKDEKKRKDGEVASAAKVEALVAVIKEAENDLSHGPNAEKCVHSLQKLRALSNMTVDILTDTGVGKVIHKLGKKDNAPERVVKYSKALVKDWKQLIAPK